MRKGNPHKGFWFYFGRVMACIGILLLLTILGIYLTVPTYSFKEPRPFEGEYLYNPYQDMNPDQWKKYHFHCHSRKYFGMTNGRKSKETAIDSVYQTLGYDHYGISDYMSINLHGADREDYIPAYEHGYGLIRKTHQICIGAKSVYRIDYPFMQNLNMKQHMLNKLGERSRFVMPAHASFTKGYKVSDMKYLSNYRLIEVVNPYGNAIEHWDMALSNGHRLYALGDDDTHDITNVHEVCRNMTMVNTPDLDPENVYDALEKGLCYAVEFDNWYYFPLTLEQKAKETHELDYLTQAQLVGDTLFIQTSAETMREVQFIGQDGKVLKTEQGVVRAYYVIQPNDTYVRTRIDLNGRNFLYLNPVTRHPTTIVVDRRLDQINWSQTILYWVVYAVALIAFAWYLFKKAKEKKNQSNAN
ncbi:MAG: hypothetical protein IJ622_04415 [Bacteroidales bacterium]|nr:hypothetical protein [Bacteroidales bacterium]